MRGGEKEREGEDGGRGVGEEGRREGEREEDWRGGERERSKEGGREGSERRRGKWEGWE